MGRSFEKMAMPEKKLLFAQDVPKVLSKQFLMIDLLLVNEVSRLCVDLAIVRLFCVGH